MRAKAVEPQRSWFRSVLGLNAKRATAARDSSYVGRGNEHAQVEEHRMSLPDGVRVYAVGDIHGCVSLLDRIHEAIAADAVSCAAEKKYVVYLGDYVDRGPDSKGVIDRLLNNVPSGLTPKYLLGNHDATLLSFLNDAEIYRTWREYGAPQTLISYGVRPPLFHSSDVFEEARLDLLDVLPKSHLAFFKALELICVMGDYLFVHAGIRPGIPLEEQTEKDLLWIRGDFLRSRTPLDRLVVHGHTPVPTPSRQRNKISVDTGAYASGVLSCAVLEGTSCRFLQVSHG
jgi:serine/threonine protein phosphatase 1